MPGSLSGGDCGQGAELTLSAASGNPVLVGKRKGELACGGAGLRGATFKVRSHNAAVVVFTIADVDTLRSKDGRPFESYEIKAGERSACDAEGANSVRALLGLPQPPAELPDILGHDSEREENRVIAVPGPLYDTFDNLNQEYREGWFNLACVRDALAKRSLFGLYTEGLDTRNETALKVVTARYCRNRAFTVRGAAFSAHSLRDEVEARWSNGRADCIGTPRLLTLTTKAGEAISPCDLPAEVQPRGCLDRCCDASEWAAALAEECGVPRCSDEREPGPPPFEFESRVYVDGLLVVAG